MTASSPTATSARAIDVLGIVGAGAMGRGIAQIAAQAGLRVKLYDTNARAVQSALDALRETLDKLAAKGKIEASGVEATMSRLQACATLEELADCHLVVEAIIEKLDVKRDLFRSLEAIVAPDAILASNTSSLSITAIAAACERPERVAGYHFFNPVPLMKVVEVIDGLRTAPEVGDALLALGRRMGHTAVRCKDMPGFIVNHAGRGMNTEGLRVASEGVASFADIDRILREQAGFRLGTFELLDLTALDVSHPVMESIYHQFYEEARFRPSPITAVRLAGGLLGRKVGEGFYRYVDGKQQVPPEAPAPDALPASVWVSRADTRGFAAVVELLGQTGVTLESGDRPSAEALIIVTPLGQDATTCAVEQGLDATRTVAVDTLLPLAGARRHTLMTTPVTAPEARDAAHALFAHGGTPVTVIRDCAGFVAQRVIATIVNIGADIAQQRIATPDDIDRAVTLGLGYAKGPLALGDAVGARLLLTVLRNLQSFYGDPRYRPSPWLTRRAQLGVSLLTEEQ
ncbi:3-hydroxyacyl-CoA dehydrogenase [Pandoraea nosoerga]|uniref:3-hydroxyacyl-CoA dehydrogenase n=1 Tax=Pandoraea nosoerga TaxID=2508296 RepID=A0A5E4TS49_9BURK|nr:3-hydroxyacyl-CoA dehydrogenase [Pandoraea nosoerga]MBN4664969.1 3-hydroxyacyl-CoA dehydrogenase [Pandoraea nosoerga]MBN4675315.1 3-hydroxyacyl-CoA dehydrogenase [Pandoraea nosoerga]MBN4680712.1 3-hydroxyacyl-CoA dehydrogenase [Pandoraea nosoerga]MBN4745898.1 3-hydroxyacyl-CoA dehydrogenase [Pandoraea nosoerga]VVD90770.1 3-hydroxyacyl-CoA dehydrogenase [Pandoraea nosoerga]